MNKFSHIKSAVLVISMTLLLTGGLYAQDTDTLLAQLTGKADAPQRSSSQLTSVYKKAITSLLPQMSADDVESRYASQIALQAIAAHASRPGAEPERVALAKVLGSFALSKDSIATVRHWFVLQIERIGKGESVSVLVTLLSDADTHLRDYARRALEKNSDASATQALLKALAASGTDSAWTIGLISALGQRGDLSVVSEITPYLLADNQDVSEAAVIALTQLGGQPSVRALQEALNGSSTVNPMKAAQGLVTVAQAMQAKNDYAGAAAIFAKLNKDAVSAYIRIAALNGLVVCDPQQGALKAAQAIKDEDSKVRAGAVMAARLAPCKAILRSLSSMLGDLDEASQIEVLGLIADRGDFTSVASVTPLLAKGPSSVKLAAVKTLTKIGCVTSAQALIEAAMSRDRAVQKAARLGLSLITGPNVEGLIVATASAGDATARAEMIQAMGVRNMTGSVDQLLTFAAESNRDVARAACKALSMVAGVDDLGAMAQLVTKVTDRAVRNDAATALKAVLTQADDEDAQIVIDQIEKASQDGKIALLKTLNAVGGSKAIGFVYSATESSDTAWKDAGIRTLSEWPDYDAAGALIVVASKESTTLIHHVVALRGALRLIKAENTVSVDKRAHLCLKALEIPRRVEEKKQAIAVLGVLPVKASADKLFELVKEDGVRNEAGLAAVELARSLRNKDRNASKALAQKIRALNISKTVNDSADRVIAGRR